MLTKWKLTLGCVWSMALMGGLFAAYYFLVGRSSPLPLPFVLFLCAFGALFDLLAISRLRVAVAQFDDVRRMRRWQSGGWTTESIKDGEQVVVFGPILPLAAQTVDSPFARQPCLFYTYQIFRWEWRSTSDGNERVKSSDYSGMRLIPSYVQSPSGSVRLLAVPALKGFDEQSFEYSEETKEIFENAFRYIEGTPFQQFGALSITKVKEIVELVKEVATDDDGSLRKDIQYSEEAFDLRSRILEETILPAGEEIGLTGVWSSAAGGVATDLSKAAVEVFRGGPQEFTYAKRREGVKAILEGVLAFGAINLIVGVFWWVTTQGPRYGSVTFSETANGEVVREETLAPAMEEWPTDTPLPPTAAVKRPTAWLLYTNEAGGYRLEYPEGWSIGENFSDDPNLNPSGWSRISLGKEPAQFQWVGLDVSYEETGGGCPDIGFEALFGEAPETSEKQVGGTAVRAFQSSLTSGDGETLITQAMRFAGGDYCYLLTLYDREGMPHQPMLDHILATFVFLEEVSP